MHLTIYMYVYVVCMYLIHTNTTVCVCVCVCVCVHIACACTSHVHAGFMCLKDVQVLAFALLYVRVHVDTPSRTCYYVAYGTIKTSQQ